MSKGPREHLILPIETASPVAENSLERSPGGSSPYVPADASPRFLERPVFKGRIESAFPSNSRKAGNLVSSDEQESQAYSKSTLQTPAGGMISATSRPSPSVNHALAVVNQLSGEQLVVTYPNDIHLIKGPHSVRFGNNASPASGHALQSMLNKRSHILLNVRRQAELQSKNEQMLNQLEQERKAPY